MLFGPFPSGGHHSFGGVHAGRLYALSGKLQAEYTVATSDIENARTGREANVLEDEIPFEPVCDSIEHSFVPSRIRGRQTVEVTAPTVWSFLTSRPPDSLRRVQRRDHRIEVFFARALCKAETGCSHTHSGATSMASSTATSRARRRYRSSRATKRRGAVRIRKTPYAAHDGARVDVGLTLSAS